MKETFIHLHNILDSCGDYSIFQLRQTFVYSNNNCRWFKRDINSIKFSALS